MPLVPNSNNKSTNKSTNSNMLPRNNPTNNTLNSNMHRITLSLSLPMARHFRLPLRSELPVAIH